MLSVIFIFITRKKKFVLNVFNNANLYNIFNFGNSGHESHWLGLELAKCYLVPYIAINRTVIKLAIGMYIMSCSD